jgi:cell division control protein 12
MMSASGTIGIANLPNQTHKIVARRGASFTLMVVGESGTGKTTFINTLLTTTVKDYRDEERRYEALNRKTTSIEVIRVGMPSNPPKLSVQYASFF